MNKKLEDTFDLPSMEEALAETKAEQSSSDSEQPNNETTEQTVVEEVTIKKALSTAEKIDRALPQVKDLESHDSDMDVYSDEAMKSYKELMDLGMNSEARHAGKFFEVAQTMMRNAIDAKNAKADKKLRMIELQLKKQRVDQQETSGSSSEDIIDGEGFVIGDRNKLLDQLIDKVSKNEEEPKEKDK